MSDEIKANSENTLRKNLATLGQVKDVLGNNAFGLLSKKKGVSIQNGTVNIILYPEDNNHVFCVDDSIESGYECQFSYSHIDASTGEEIITQINPTLDFEIGDLIHVRVDEKYNYIRLRTIVTEPSTGKKQEGIYNLTNENQWEDNSISSFMMNYHISSKSEFNQGLLDFCAKYSIGILNVHSKPYFVIKQPFERGSGNVIVIGDMADGMVCKYYVSFRDNEVRLVKAL